jgi:hypothetical protein
VILVDAGPLVALVDADDQHHRACVDALKHLSQPMATVWPAITEAVYLVADVPGAQDVLWEMLERQAIHILRLDVSDVPRIRELMHEYADRPMDLADAALVRSAEREGIRTIFTVDRKDFAVYRLHGRRRFTVIP